MFQDPDKPIDFPTISIWYVLPPLALLAITRLGIPVSTTFLVLTFFAPKAFQRCSSRALGVWRGVPFCHPGICGFESDYGALFPPASYGEKPRNPALQGFWTVTQWLATGFLWSQWLTQDLVNILVYLGDPAEVALWKFLFALTVLVGMLGYIFYQRGGEIQKIVRVKTNTADIRSATFIDLFYGLVLLTFKFDTFGIGAKVPMSTTWVFLGMLAGREVALRLRLNELDSTKVWPMVLGDLGKATLGLVISVLLVVFLYLVEGRELAALFG